MSTWRFMAFIDFSKSWTSLGVIPRSSAPKFPSIGVNLLKVAGIGGERAVIHHASGEARLMNRQLQGEASAHAPSDRADVIAIHVLSPGQVHESRLQIADRSVLGQSAHQLVSLFRIGRYFAAVEVHRQRDVSLAG